MTNPALKEQAKRASVVVLSVNPTVKGVWISERYDLYTKNEGFFDRLSNPQQAKYYHRQAQRAFMEQDNVYEFKTENSTIYAEFNLDTDDHLRCLIIDRYLEGIAERIVLNEQ